MAGCIKMAVDTEVGLGGGDIVLDGDPAPPKNGTVPQFLAHVYCGQTAVCIRIPLGTVIGLNLGDIVLAGAQFRSPEGHSPQFSDNVCCGQTAGWTKMPLGMEVGLGKGDFVFSGNPAPPQRKGHSPRPIFGPCLLWPLYLRK